MSTTWVLGLLIWWLWWLWRSRFVERPPVFGSAQPSCLNEIAVQLTSYRPFCFWRASVTLAALTSPSDSALCNPTNRWFTHYTSILKWKLNGQLSQLHDGREYEDGHGSQCAKTGCLLSAQVAIFLNVIEYPTLNIHKSVSPGKLPGSRWGSQKWPNHLKRSLSLACPSRTFGRLNMELAKKLVIELWRIFLPILIFTRAFSNHAIHCDAFSQWTWSMGQTLPTMMQSVRLKHQHFTFFGHLLTHHD